LRNPLVLSRFFDSKFFFQAGSSGGHHGKLISRVRFQGRPEVSRNGNCLSYITYTSVLKSAKEPPLSERTTLHWFLLQSKIDGNSDQFGW
jgi:hypothetical protein